MSMFYTSDSGGGIDKDSSGRGVLEAKFKKPLYPDGKRELDVTQSLSEKRSIASWDKPMSKKLTF